MEKKEIKEKKPKKKLSKGAIVLIIGLIIILIPCLVFGGILLSASLQTGNPVVGNRFDNDLKPAIADSETKALKATIETMSGVEKCEIVLKSAQYRINVDTDDSLSTSQIESLCVDIYNAVNSKLPVSTYFTASSSMKMYDLSINVYNFIDGESENMTYYILTKNSQMTDYSIQCVSEAVDEDLAKELRGETNITTGTGDVSVDGETGEEPVE